MTKSSVQAKSVADTGPHDPARILAAHGRWLRTILYARLQESQAVEDVFQEVSLALMRGKSLPTDEAQIAPWLYRVAIRQVMLYRRTMGRKRKLEARFACDRQPSEHDARCVDPLQWLLAKERKNLLREAMNRLVPRDAEMLMLKYGENWNYHQIAERLGISHSAVESRLHRSRARLREELLALENADSNQVVVSR